MTEERDVVVVGAGPAGLQIGYYLQRDSRSYVVLERANRPGSFFEHYPRRRLLISVNKVHTGYDEPERNLRWDWNSLLTDDYSLLFKSYSQDYFPSADALLSYLAEYAERFVPNIRYECAVEAIERAADGGFIVRTSTGEDFRAKAVVVATGFSQPYLPAIEGIELAETYGDFNADPDSFQGKRVLIIGKGNSAFETADEVIHKASLIHVVSPTSVKFAWNTHYPGNLRALNNNFLDTYQLKLGNAILDATVSRIRKRPDGALAVAMTYSHARGEVEELMYDRVICCTGFQLDPRIFGEGCRPKRVHLGRLPQITPRFESVNVPDMYFAGTMTQSLDFKKSNSSFIHGFRYNARMLYWLLARRLYGEELPSEEVEVTPRSLTEKLLTRINCTSALWQQFGYMCDVAVIQNGKGRYYRDLTLPYVHSSEIADNDCYFTLSLEFGQHVGDVFSVQRDPDANAAEKSFFLHPVIRRFSRGGILVRTHHLLENLLGEWTHDELHRRPLLEFIGSQLFPYDALLKAVERSHPGPPSETPPPA